MNTFHKFAVRFILMAALVGFILLTIAGYSAVRPSVLHIKDTNIIDIRNYGAIPDDEIDDGVAILAAIADLKSGDIFRVPKGLYYTSSILNFDELEDITLEFEGVITGLPSSSPQYIIRIGGYTRCSRFSGNIKVGETYTKYEAPQSSVKLPSTKGVFIYDLGSGNLSIDSNGFGVGLETNTVSGCIFTLGQFYSNEVGIRTGVGGTFLGGTFKYPTTGWCSTYYLSTAIVCDVRGAKVRNPSISGNVNYVKVSGNSNRVTGVNAVWDYSALGDYNQELLYDNSEGPNNVVEFTYNWEKYCDSTTKLDKWCRKIDLAGYIVLNNDELLLIIDNEFAREGIPYVLHNTASDTYERGFLGPGISDVTFSRVSTEHPLMPITPSNITDYDIYIHKIKYNKFRNNKCDILGLNRIGYGIPQDAYQMSSISSEKSVFKTGVVYLKANKNGQGFFLRCPDSLLTSPFILNAGGYDVVKLATDGRLLVHKLELDNSVAESEVFACLDSPSNTTISAIDTWTTIQGTFTNSPIVNFSLQTDKLRYDNTATRSFSITYATTLKSSSPDTQVSIGVYINGGLNSCSIMSHKAKTAGDPYHLGGCTVVTLGPLDTIQLRVKANKTCTITFDNLITKAEETIYQPYGNY